MVYTHKNDLLFLMALSMFYQHTIREIITKIYPLALLDSERQKWRRIVQILDIARLDIARYLFVTQGPEYEEVCNSPNSKIGWIVHHAFLALRDKLPSKIYEEGLEIIKSREKKVQEIKQEKDKKMVDNENDEERDDDEEVVFMHQPKQEPIVIDDDDDDDEKEDREVTQIKIPMKNNEVPVIVIDGLKRVPVEIERVADGVVIKHKKPRN